MPQSMEAEPERRSGRLATMWALAGSAVVLTHAAVRLGAQGLDTVRNGLGSGEWLALVVLTTAFVYGEGVLALERRFIPHLVDRSRRLAGEGSAALRILGPLYAFSLVGAPARALVRAWAGVAAIVLAVVTVRALPDPWRGIVDLAVAAALAWAVVALLRQSPRALR